MENIEMIRREIERIITSETDMFDEQCKGGFEPSVSIPVVVVRMRQLLKFIDGLPTFVPTWKSIHTGEKLPYRSLILYGFDDRKWYIEDAGTMVNGDAMYVPIGDLKELPKEYVKSTAP